MSCANLDRDESGNYIDQRGYVIDEQDLISFNIRGIFFCYNMHRLYDHLYKQILKNKRLTFPDTGMFLLQADIRHLEAYLGGPLDSLETRNREYFEDVAEQAIEREEIRQWAEEEYPFPPGY